MKVSLNRVELVILERALEQYRSQLQHCSSIRIPIVKKYSLNVARLHGKMLDVLVEEEQS